RDVKVTEDKDKRVITLDGKVRSDEDKARAEQLAKGAAPGWVVANEVSIEPQGAERQARAIESNLDGSIDKDYKAVLIAHRMDHIRYDVKNGVITLKGNVDTPQQRSMAEQLAAKTPNVSQVVNELQVKHR
ncbi:MAG: BON domain-containing protein, partial [Acidobacteria bacterium]|nr:BON domain-containing protein [Acidobacteriota bacterium]